VRIAGQGCRLRSRHPSENRGCRAHSDRSRRRQHLRPAWTLTSP